MNYGHLVAFLDQYERLGIVEVKLCGLWSWEFFGSQVEW